MKIGVLASVFECLELRIEREAYDEIPQYVLVKVYRYLLAAEDGLDRSASRTGDISVQVRRAKEKLAGMLNEVPIRSEYSEGTVVQYLQGADALAEEHLSAANDEGEIRLAIRKAISQARRKL